jgi:opacity protein-like surface antigen
MKIIVSSIAFATLLTSITITQAQPYLTADGGAVLQQDSILHVMLNGVQQPNSRISYNPGYRFDLAAGGDINPWVGANVSGGYAWNSIDKSDGVSISSEGEKADFYSFPLLGNLIFKLPNPTPLVPYVGVGGGAVVSIFHFKSTLAGQPYADYSPSDVEPAVQGQAGVNFMLCRNASIGVSYKFLATLDERYDADTPSGPVRYRFDDVFEHALFLNFTLRF